MFFKQKNQLKKKFLVVEINVAETSFREFASTLKITANIALILKYLKKRLKQKKKNNSFNNSMLVQILGAQRDTFVSIFSQYVFQ